MRDKSAPAGSQSDRVGEVIAIIRQGLVNMRFGSLAVTIHEGEVTQLEITEKKRFATR